MISEHDEIEAKLSADGVELDGFRDFVQSHRFSKYEEVIGPDTYYESGDVVVRHRQDLRTGQHELTVKRRKSAKSTRDREEIDLKFSERTSTKDVAAFLKATGFTPVFMLVKIAHIYWLESDGVPMTVVFYDVWQQEPGSEPLRAVQAGAKRFVEVEAEKGSDALKRDAKAVVDTWVKRFQTVLGLGEPLNESLYEIYSGKRYQSV
jgi:hypothetical protein